MKVFGKYFLAFCFVFFLAAKATLASPHQVPVYDVYDPYAPLRNNIVLAALDSEGPHGFSLRTERGEFIVSYTKSEHLAHIASGYAGLDLSHFRRWESNYFTPEEIREMSMNDLRRLWNQPPTANLGGKHASLPVATIAKVIDSMRNHPVIGREQARKYDPGYVTRFCFGQATYAHHVLLSLGLHPDSIRKVFIVGPRMMPTTGLESGFHVATVAYADDGNWYTVDVGFRAPMRLMNWFQHFSNQSTDQKLRLYVTPPDRFAPGNPIYTEVDLGLSLSRETDFYKGYFVDLFAWLRESRNLEDLGFQVWPANQVEWPSVTARYIYR